MADRADAQAQKEVQAMKDKSKKVKPTKTPPRGFVAPPMIFPAAEITADMNRATEEIRRLGKENADLLKVVREHEAQFMVVASETGELRKRNAMLTRLVKGLL
jgi:hypothetical protein